PVAAPGPRPWADSDRLRSRDLRPVTAKKGRLAFCLGCFARPRQGAAGSHDADRLPTDHLTPLRAAGSWLSGGDSTAAATKARAQRAKKAAAPSAAQCRSGSGLARSLSRA